MEILKERLAELERLLLTAAKHQHRIIKLNIEETKKFIKLFD